jgi:Rrf2 family transcriptional regulator, cysteine metabolism repressor
MKFSTRTLYGLKAVLVLAGRFGEGSMPVSQIARKERLSVAYLEQILNGLKKKGFVKSVRGPQGGYVLARKPSETSLKELFDVLGDAKAVPAATVSSESDEVAIGNMLFWKKLHRSLEEGLERVSLKELVDEARRIKKGKPHASYNFNI